jgi:hypothetical protein
MTTQQSILVVPTTCGQGRPIRWIAGILSGIAELFNESQQTLKNAQKRYPYFVEL